MGLFDFLSKLVVILSYLKTHSDKSFRNFGCGKKIVIILLYYNYYICKTVFATFQNGISHHIVSDISEIDKSGR